MIENKINVNQHKDVNNLVTFVNVFKIVSQKQAIVFLKQFGLSNEKISIVFNIVKRERKLFFSKENTYLASNKFIFEQNYNQIFAQNNELIWVYIYLFRQVPKANIECKYPCKMFAYDSDSEKSIHIFKVKHSTMEDDCIAIDTNFSTVMSKVRPIKSIIIVENLDDIEKIILPETINILAFVHLEYLDSGECKVNFYNNKN